MLLKISVSNAIGPYKRFSIVSNALYKVTEGSFEQGSSFLCKVSDLRRQPGVVTKRAIHISISTVQSQRLM